MSKFLPLLFLIAIGTNQAFASLEIRAHYSQWQGDGKDFNDATAGLGTWPDAKAPAFLGGDVLLVMPVLGFTIGARHETMQEQKASGSYNDATDGLTQVDHKITASRTSLLAGYRFIDTGLFLGILGHYGLSKELEYSFTVTDSDSSASVSTKGTMAASYGVGIEGGFHAMGLLIGGEIGHTIFKADKLDGFKINGDPAPMDFSGTYFRVMAGFSFL